MFNIQKIKNYAINLHNFFKDLLFPIECLNCQKANTWLCSNCSNLIKKETLSICPACGKENENSKYCSSCKKKYNLTLSGVWIAFQYQDKIINKLIKTLKYKFIKDISTILANELINFIENKEEIKKIIYSKNTIIIPIPLHLKKLKWREFNQAEEIAKELAKKLNLNINTKNLIKIKNNKSQTSLKRNQRIDNVKNVYSWTGENLNSKTIILIDDVITSGATLNECAKILKQNKARKIWGLVIAKNTTF